MWHCRCDLIKQNDMEKHMIKFFATLILIFYIINNIKLLQFE